MCSRLAVDHLIARMTSIIAVAGAACEANRVESSELHDAQAFL